VWTEEKSGDHVTRERVTEIHYETPEKREWFAKRYASQRRKTEILPDGHTPSNIKTGRGTSLNQKQ
jgi:hypothetical protein